MSKSWANVWCLMREGSHRVNLAKVTNHPPSAHVPVLRWSSSGLCLEWGKDIAPPVGIPCNQCLSWSLLGGWWCPSPWPLATHPWQNSLQRHALLQPCSWPARPSSSNPKAIGAKFTFFRAPQIPNVQGWGELNTSRYKSFKVSPRFRFVCLPIWEAAAAASSLAFFASAASAATLALPPSLVAASPATAASQVKNSSSMGGRDNINQHHFFLRSLLRWKCKMLKYLCRYIHTPSLLQTTEVWAETQATKIAIFIMFCPCLFFGWSTSSSSWFRCLDRSNLRGHLQISSSGPLFF